MNAQEQLERRLVAVEHQLQQLRGLHSVLPVAGGLLVAGSILGSRATAVKMYRGSDTAVAHGTPTAIRFTNAVFATEGTWPGIGDPTKLIAPADGVYAVGGSWFMPSTQNTAQVRQAIIIYQNGVSLQGADQTPLAGKHIGHSIATLTLMAAGDYVEIYIYHEMGETKTIPAAAMNTLGYQSGWLARIA